MDVPVPEDKMRGILLGQIEKQLEVCEETIGLVPDASWADAPKNATPFAAELYHILDGIRIYLDFTMEGRPFSWDPRYLDEDGKVNWSRDLSACHSKEEMLSLLASVRDRVRDDFARPEMNSHLSGDLKPKHTNRHIGESFFQGLIYLIRHTQQHIGIICCGLRRHGVTLPEWK